MMPVLNICLKDSMERTPTALNVASEVSIKLRTGGATLVLGVPTIFPQQEELSSTSQPLH